QTLTLESKFEAKEGERFGWVVPVPALPEIASPDTDTDFRYGMLETRTKARLIESGHLAVGGILLLLVAWLVFLARRGRWPSALGVVVAIVVLAAVALPSYMGIEVVKE